MMTKFEDPTTDEIARLVRCLRSDTWSSKSKEQARIAEILENWANGLAQISDRRYATEQKVHELLKLVRSMCGPDSE